MGLREDPSEAMTDDQLAEIEARLNEYERLDGDFSLRAVEKAMVEFEGHAPDDIRLLLREVRALQERLSADFARAGECVG